MPHAHAVAVRDGGGAQTSDSALTAAHALAIVLLPLTLAPLPRVRLRGGLPACLPACLRRRRIPLSPNQDTHHRHAGVRRARAQPLLRAGCLQPVPRVLPNRPGKHRGIPQACACVVVFNVWPGRGGVKGRGSRAHLPPHALVVATHATAHHSTPACACARGERRAGKPRGSCVESSATLPCKPRGRPCGAPRP